MGITFDPSRPSADQISKLYTGRFATPEEKEAMEAAKAEGNDVHDQVEISQEGQDAAASAPAADGIDFDEMAKKTNAWLSSMTQDEFMDLMREQLGEPEQLEINWVAVVDPDHMIWTKTYADSMLSQCKEVAGVIKDYYADAYQDAMNSPLGNSLTQRLNYIAAKYLCSWSDYYDASIPDGERPWLYDQLSRMLTGRRVVLNDPYALAGTGLNQDGSIDKNARKAATDKIEELIRQAKAEAGIVE